MASSVMAALRKRDTGQPALAFAVRCSKVA
jgi:hypothetical protein